MADAERREALQEHFGAAVESPELMALCLSLCKTFNATPEELFYSWESFTYNADARMSQLTEDRIPAFRDHLQRELKKTQTKKAIGGGAASSSTPAKVGVGKGIKNAFGARALAGASGTPLKREVGDTVDTPIKVESFAPSMAFASSSGSGGTKSRVVPGERVNEFKYRYMYEKALDRGEVLNTRIDQFGSYVKEYYDVELADPNLEDEKDIVVVGRIVDDRIIEPSETADPKFTEAALVLEPSRGDGGGKRIPLRFAPNLRFHSDPLGSTSTRPGIGLYPGAIAAFKGTKAHGHEGPFFMVREVLPIPPLPPPTKTAKRGSDISYSVLVASGPYTYDADLNYQPFLSILTTLKQMRPQALVLLGPFVDSTHPLIVKGELTETFDEIFTKKIAGPLRRYVTQEQPDLSVAFVPHVRDAISYWNVFPQSAEFGPESIRGWKPAAPTPPWVFLPNPSLFSIHGVEFGATSVDALFHLRKQEVFKLMPGAVQQDPMAGLCRHILDQRSFYPMFPVPRDVSTDVNLDLTHSHLLAIHENAPDIVILPSRLKEFSKAVDGTVFINPSTATKFGKSLGMVAKVTVDGMRSGPERILVDLVNLV